MVKRALLQPVLLKDLVPSLAAEASAYLEAKGRPDLASQVDTCEVVSYRYDVVTGSGNLYLSSRTTKSEIDERLRLDQPYRVEIEVDRYGRLYGLAFQPRPDIVPALVSTGALNLWEVEEAGIQKERRKRAAKIRAVPFFLVISWCFLTGIGTHIALGSQLAGPGRLPLYVYAPACAAGLNFILLVAAPKLRPAVGALLMLANPLGFLVLCVVWSGGI
jgi:hypothetical protein